jgi:ABC-2 type transport system ATP-binding protein
MTALAARGIRKSFRRRRVLAGLDLEVAAGELVAVVGENGTGKTTLLRILAGDLRPDAGSVVVAGRPGYCPQTVVRDEALRWTRTCATSRPRTGSAAPTGPRS